jgi:hypothetical protein
MAGGLLGLPRSASHMAGKGPPAPESTHPAEAPAFPTLGHQLPIMGIHCTMDMCPSGSAGRVASIDHPAGPAPHAAPIARAQDIAAAFRAGRVASPGWSSRWRFPVGCGFHSSCSAPARRQCTASDSALGRAGGAPGHERGVETAPGVPLRRSLAVQTPGVVAGRIPHAQCRLQAGPGAGQQPGSRRRRANFCRPASGVPPLRMALSSS